MLPFVPEDLTMRVVQMAVVFFTLLGTVVGYLTTMRA